MSNKKSGQAALILVIVTLVTVLGIGIASSTQSTVNLRDTVYSTQSEQALACAEAGGEYGIGVITAKDEFGSGNYDPTAPSSQGSGTGYLPCDSSGSCVVSPAPSKYDCSFEYAISIYPGEDHIVDLARLNENVVQELNFKDVGSATDLKFNFSIISGNKAKAAIAVYSYQDLPGDGVQVSRKFYQLGSDDKPTDYDAKFDASPSVNTLTIPLHTVAVRIRPLYADLSIKLGDYPENVAVSYKLTSVGRAGPVRREMEVFRFLSQLPAAFDEAVVMLNQ